MTYTSLEQRMAQAYIDMFPQFVPDEQASVSVAEQEVFYNLIKDLYKLAFDEPQLFVPALHEDDAYPKRFNKSSYGNPSLQVNIRKFMKEMDTLLQNMFLMGKGCSVKLNKRQQVILSRLGIDSFTGLPEAWIWMSNRPETHLMVFSKCFFKRDYPYTSDIYARLLGDEAFRMLENWMISQGYKRYDIYDVTASDCNLSLTYANPAWSKERPSGGFEYKIRHTGISVRYDAAVRKSPIFGLCIPNGFKPYLDAFNLTSKDNQSFIIGHTKRCDACRYCVQTDKTGTRPLAYIPIDYKNNKYNLCPYFPGYGFCWTSIDNSLADQLIEMMTFMDKFVTNDISLKK
jgi:hypothetical protein